MVLFAIQRFIMLWNKDFFLFYEIPNKDGLDDARIFSAEETGFFVAFQLRDISTNQRIAKEEYEDYV